MLKDLFRSSRSRYVTVRPEGPEGESSPPQKDIPDHLWAKCEACSSLIYQKELAKEQFVCSKCGHHFYVPAYARLAQIADEDTFSEWDRDVHSTDPLEFPGYSEKLARAREETGLGEGILTGRASIGGYPVGLGILDFQFIKGSMGSAVGEKVARLFERALERDLPVVIISGGGGGARMQEGILSLMQMAKTSQAVGRYARCRRPYISVLTHPTMAGIYASFASLGDYVLAEPGALIGFAGPRIVKQATHQSLPKGFQTSEFVLRNGMLDRIVDRRELRGTLIRLLRFHA